MGGHELVHEPKVGLNLAQFRVLKLKFREDAFLEHLPNFCSIQLLGPFNLSVLLPSASKQNGEVK